VIRAPRGRGAVALAAACASVLFAVGVVRPSLAHAEPRADAFGGTPVDQVAARFSAPETGGPEHPRFVTMRMLAFETRLAALEEGESLTDGTYPERLARTALERHMAEEILSSLIATRAIDPAVFGRQVQLQRVGLVESVGGQAALVAAMHAEGISDDELAELVARRVRASTYVDRAITRILHPSDDELRTAYRTGSHPFRKQKFDDARDALERWLVDQRLRAEEQSFFQEARARVLVSFPQASSASSLAAGPRS
jgi:hypothetical protein